jgi:hypothetical protein
MRKRSSMVKAIISDFKDIWYNIRIKIDVI